MKSYFGGNILTNFEVESCHIGNTKDDCKISIITVVYNGSETLARTIESVLNQEYAPYEYIIVDGLSTDNSVAIAHGYASSFALKGINYRIISEHDNGMYDALNKGTKLAVGDIIGQINADDWYQLDALKNVAKVYKETNFDYFCGDLYIIKRTGNMLKKAKIDKFVTSHHWSHPTTFFKSCVAKAHPYCLQSMYDDFDLYLRLRKENLKAVVLNEVIANFTFGGMSNKKSIKAAMYRAKIKWEAYRRNGYVIIYYPECYGRELAKYLLS